MNRAADKPAPVPSAVTLVQSRDSEEMASPAVAFFDLDGTLVVGQTTLLLVRFLRKERIVSRTFLVGTGLWFLAYMIGLVKVTERSRNQGARVFAGRSIEEVDGLMDRFTEEILVPRFHPAATAALAEHQAVGDRVVVISAALEPVVGAVCRWLGVPDFVGTACEIEQGRYLGRLVSPSPHAEEKARVAAEYLKRWAVDAADCWAYADHGSDMTLLQSVGHPVAVNPRPELLAAAQTAGWPVLP
jgi:HAD superfamily hydrolase (TIGR01490 family)